MSTSPSLTRQVLIARRYDFSRFCDLADRLSVPTVKPASSGKFRFLKMAAQQTMFEDQVAAEAPGWTPRLPSLDDTRTQTTATVSHQEILARPIFSRSRAPFVPPAPPAPKPARPPVAFTDPGFVLGGVMVNGTITSPLSNDAVRLSYVRSRGKADKTFSQVARGGQCPASPWFDKNTIGAT